MAIAQILYGAQCLMCCNVMKDGIEDPYSNLTLWSCTIHSMQSIIAIVSASLQGIDIQLLINSHSLCLCLCLSILLSTCSWPVCPLQVNGLHTFCHQKVCGMGCLCETSRGAVLQIQHGAGYSYHGSCVTESTRWTWKRSECVQKLCSPQLTVQKGPRSYFTVRTTLNDPSDETSHRYTSPP